MHCYIFDIDGTLADETHRNHLIQQDPPDWDSYFSLCHLDPPIPHVVRLAQTLALDCLSGGTSLVFASGRSDVCRVATTTWLRQQGLYGDQLYMRAAEDHRPDDVIKEDLLDQMLLDGWEPIMVFDDRTRVVEMWRRRGIPCAQVAPGDY